MNESTNEQFFNRLVLQESIRIAKAGSCSSIFFFQDAFGESIPDILPTVEDTMRIIVVTQRAMEIFQKGSIYTLPIRLFATGRLTQLRSAILVALIHKYIRYDEKICCIGGLPNSNRLDTIVMVDVKQEIQSLFSQQGDILPKNVLAEVFERLLSITTELAIEGREGKSVGCMFVVGNPQQLANYVHPLILNPFYGYAPEERNVLNPAIDETIKEYALLDGAFIVSEQGILESAGAWIHVKDSIGDDEESLDLPKGLGTRHASAVAISTLVDCVVITLSSSSNQISIVRKGKILPLFDKDIGCSNREA